MLGAGQLHALVRRHVALLEIGDCLQIDSHMVKDYRKKSSARRAGRRSPTLVATKEMVCRIQEVPSWRDLGGGAEERI